MSPPYLFTTLKNLFLKQVERRKRQEPMAEVPEPALPQPIEDDPQRSLLLAEPAGRGSDRERDACNRASGSCSRSASSRTARTPRSASSSG